MKKEKETKMEEMMADEETEPETPPMRKNKKYLKTSNGYMKKGK